ncbi:MAG: aerotolerance regulator BatC, partial [Flavobacteriaceae bacterium]|nr:aerotolerance regulator BatC [Flavobacteriaceae bacterium]MBT6698951.1 aerotolerance regulator BatC [Flavobacteriales bacterium]
EEKKESLSKEEIEQILNALEREEKEVQEDLQKKKIIGGNKLLKDW